MHTQLCTRVLRSLEITKCYHILYQTADVFTEACIKCRLRLMNTYLSSIYVPQRESDFFIQALTLKYELSTCELFIFTSSKSSSQIFNPNIGISFFS